MVGCTSFHVPYGHPPSFVRWGIAFGYRYTYYPSSTGTTVRYEQMDDPADEAQASSSRDSEATPPDTAPPYFPFRSLTNLLVRMESEGIPRRLDRGYLKNMAGGTIAQFITGVRALGLIDADERPLPALRELVAARENRPEAIGQLLRARYGWAIQLGQEGATQQELDEAFRERGVSGSTLRKAVAFYLQGAKYSGLPLSAFFREPRVTPEGTSRRGARRRSPAATDVVPEAPATPRPTPQATPPTIAPVQVHSMLQGSMLWLAENGPTWTEAMSDAWISSFENQVKLVYPVKRTQPKPPGRARPESGADAGEG